MAVARARRLQGRAEYWPSFVDVLTNLLLVFIFLLSVFALVQFLLSREISGRDTVLQRLNQQIAELTEMLALERATNSESAENLAAMTAKFEQGLVELGFETIPGPHPVVPLMVRDTDRTTALVRHLYQNGVLATGLNYPVVPKGDEEIRFQVNADHTTEDIGFVLEVLAAFDG